jgi:hypothetical protein
MTEDAEFFKAGKGDVLWRDRRQRSSTVLNDVVHVGKKKLREQPINYHHDDLMGGDGAYDDFSDDIPRNIDGDISEADESGDDHNISVENKNNTCSNYEDVDLDNNLGNDMYGSVLNLDSFDRLSLLNNPQFNKTSLESDDEHDEEDDPRTDAAAPIDIMMKGPKVTLPVSLNFASFYILCS